jgi:hypothetical protein
MTHCSTASPSAEEEEIQGNMQRHWTHTAKVVELTAAQEKSKHTVQMGVRVKKGQWV